MFFIIVSLDHRDDAIEENGYDTEDYDSHDHSSKLEELRRHFAGKIQPLEEQEKSGASWFAQVLSVSDLWRFAISEESAAYAKENSVRCKPELAYRNSAVF